MRRSRLRRLGVSCSAEGSSSVGCWGASVVFAVGSGTAAAGLLGSCWIWFESRQHSPSSSVIWSTCRTVSWYGGGGSIVVSVAVVDIRFKRLWTVENEFDWFDGGGWPLTDVGTDERGPR